MKKLLTRFKKTLSSLSLNKARNLFWKISTIVMKMKPSTYGVRIRLENLLYPFVMETRIYKPGDIVFIKFSPDKAPSHNWPCIGSSHEIDCKIVESVPHSSGDPKKTLYRIISGRGFWLQSYVNNLVHPSEKDLFKDAPMYRCTLDTELCPKDTVFIMNGDYACNDFYGIYIHKLRLNELLDNGSFVTYAPDPPTT